MARRMRWPCSELESHICTYRYLLAFELYVPCVNFFSEFLPPSEQNRVAVRTQTPGTYMLITFYNLFDKRCGRTSPQTMETMDEMSIAESDDRPAVVAVTVMVMMWLLILVMMLLMMGWAEEAHSWQRWRRRRICIDLLCTSLLLVRSIRNGYLRMRSVLAHPMRRFSWWFGRRDRHQQQRICCFGWWCFNNNDDDDQTRLDMCSVHIMYSYIQRGKSKTLLNSCT